MSDKIIITPVYKADDIETAPVTADDLYKALKSQDKNVLFANDRPEIQNILLAEKFSINDIIIFAGAGSISKWAHEVVKNIGTYV